MFTSCKFESCRPTTLIKINFVTDMFLRFSRQAQQNHILPNYYLCKTRLSPKYPLGGVLQNTHSLATGRCSTKYPFFSYWEVFYKTPRSLAIKRCSTKYPFLSLNQPLGGSLQNTHSHREVLYKIHWEVFYKIPCTMWCSTKYHWKSFYKIPVINNHWVIFHKTKYPFTLGGAPN